MFESAGVWLDYRRFVGQGCGSLLSENIIDSDLGRLVGNVGVVNCFAYLR